MDKFQMLINSIDWIFASVILIGGRYFGSKYFRLSKRDSINFLGFATVFAVIYLFIIYYTQGIGKNQVVNLFITYLIVTSFYELLAKMFFDWIEGKLGLAKPVTVQEAVTKFENVTGDKVVDKENIPPPPPDEKKP